MQLLVFVLEANVFLSDCNFFSHRELAFFFPEYQVPKVAARGRHMAHTDISGVQRTLALIRPDALAEKRGQVSTAVLFLYSCVPDGCLLYHLLTIQAKSEMLNRTKKQHHSMIIKISVILVL